MSSRIIRGDGRVHKSIVSVNVPPEAAAEAISEQHIMSVEKQAFEQGYAEGERSGREMGEAMVESACKRYEKSIAELAASHKRMAQAMEEETVKLSLEIARRILQREVTVDADLVGALVTVALKRLAGHQSISVRVARQDFERVRAAVGAVNPAVTVREDLSLERADFVIDTAQTHLDGRLSSQLETIGRALLDE
jgi:flagellar assembly protein FliH